MKRNICFQIFFAFAFLVLADVDILAQADWGTYNYTSSATVNLTENKKLTKPIVIRKGATLTINNTTGKALTLSNGQGATADRMFQIMHGGTLKIQGNASSTIIIDGGAAFPEWSKEYGFTADQAAKKLKECIYCHGTLSLKYARIQNVCGTLDNNTGGAINIQSVWSSGNACGTTTVENSIITKCMAPTGSALLLGTQNQGTSQTPENCKVTILNSEIFNCSSDGGGTVRSIGAAVANLYLTNTVIHHNFSSSGAGLYWNAHGLANADTKCIINGCTFSDNIATNRGGGMMLESSFEFTGNQTLVTNNTAGDQGGGIVINGYNGGLITGGTLNLKLNDKLRVTNNSSRYGGGISFNFGQMSFTQPTTYNAIIDGCIISNNIASDQGGAICFRNRTADYTQKTQINIGIRMESGTFENNTAVNSGGALYVDNTNISYTSPQAADAMVLMKGNKVTGQSGEGGGLYLTNGTVTAGKMTLEDNSASKGGAMFVLGTLTIEGSSKVAGNVAGDCAGGIYVEGGNLYAASSIEITDNHAANLGGGVVVEGGNLYFRKSDIARNRAGYDTSDNIINQNASGGAICVNQGSITIDEGDIYDNYSTLNGGAIYASHNDFTTDPKTITLTSDGVFQQNQSSYGGGMYVSGNIKMVFAGNIMNNHAVNGGGLFLSNGAELSVTGGILKHNKAKGLVRESKPLTGYHASAADLHGVGGGVYLDSGMDDSHPTNLIFKLTGNSIGLYDNAADWGADDIFANGLNTSVTLPDIKQMTITDFYVPADTPLFWAEDYITNDPNYDKGTKEKTTWSIDPTNERYDYSIKNSRPSYHITFTDKTKVLDSYISLQVGYELVFVTLIKKGLSPGENATFTFTPAKQINSDGEYEVVEGTEPYISVIFICKNNDQTVNGVVRKLLIPIGWWKIEETSWTWAYDSAEEDKEKYKNAIIIDNNTNKRLEFTNVRRTDVPATSESVVVNEMKSSIAEFTEE